MKKLQDYQFINLKTFRKNGEGVVTTVWFANQSDKKLVMLTLPSAGKLKRIGNNPQVELAPCNSTGKEVYGDYIMGSAHLLEGAEAETANRTLNQKYGWQKRMFGLFWGLRGAKPVFIEILLD